MLSFAIFLKLSARKKGGTLLPRPLETGETQMWWLDLEQNPEQYMLAPFVTVARKSTGLVGPQRESNDECGGECIVCVGTRTAREGRCRVKEGWDDRFGEDEGEKRRRKGIRRRGKLMRRLE